MNENLFINGTRIFVSGSMKKSTGNYGMIEVNFGISKDVKDDDNLE